MKKTSIDTVLLLSSIYSKKQIGDLFKDIRSLDADQIEVMLKRVDEHRAATLATVSEEIGAQLERQREQSGTVHEIQYLLLTRYKLKVPVAAKQLSEQLARKGYTSSFEGSSTKANFIKWLRYLCEQIPREDVMSAALNLNSRHEAA